MRKSQVSSSPSTVRHNIINKNELFTYSLIFTYFTYFTISVGILFLAGNCVDAISTQEEEEEEEEHDYCIGIDYNWQATASKK